MSAQFASIDTSTQERRERIRARRLAAIAQEERIRGALFTLRMDCNTEDDAVRALHAISAGLMSTKPLPSTDLLETVEWIDQLADRDAAVGTNGETGIIDKRQAHAPVFSGHEPVPSQQLETGLGFDALRTALNHRRTGALLDPGNLGVKRSRCQHCQK